MLRKKIKVYNWCPSTTDIIYTDKRKRMRCPICGRRLLLQELKYEGGIGYRFPPHKTYKNVGIAL